ncbi:hypothetical protein ACMD2_02615 [Ananas comosus]|uniref:Uncharacterized protein n=1 Tax=Ananas comosus TaxID=4615 RepID=A0A199V874_ANACO|nr:hypothetical protein ACMD2_02615 [Ananas comosus]
MDSLLPGDEARRNANGIQQTISISKVEKLYLISSCWGTRLITPNWWYDPKLHGPTVRIFSRGDANYSLTIRSESVVFAPTDPKDERQYWIKDNRVNSKVRDEEGSESFALVNKATGQAIKHSFGHGLPVQLIPYNPSYVDESLLWTESKDVVEGFRGIRMVNNLNLRFDALTGIITDGTVLGLFKTNNVDNQRWQMHWIKDTRYSAKVKDEDGKPAFALVNKATGEALKHSFGFSHYVRLIPYNPDYFDESVLWTESDDLGDGFHTIRMVNNTALLFDSLNSVPAAGGVRVGNPLCLWRWNQGNNQRWKIIPYFSVAAFVY